MVERILGIDLGISSLGWAIVEHDKENIDNNKIIDCGVRLFTAAQTPKEKKSPNKARREARGIRRLIGRKRVRMNEIKKLLIANNLLNKEDIDAQIGIFNAPKTKNPKASRKDVWELRHDALFRLLEPLEFARVLIHIAKRRGYKFIGDEVGTDDESGKVKKAGAALKALFESKDYKTVGEWLWSERGHNNKKRNKSGDYEISIPRDFLVNEVNAIFEAQRKHNNRAATTQLQKEYIDMAFFVRPMQSIAHMVGSCTYMPEEKRAPKASPTAERFVAIGKFYSTVVVDNEGNEYKIVELKSIDELMEFATSKGDLKYSTLRKFLELNENQIFKGLTYKSRIKKPKKGQEAVAEEWEFDKAEAEKKIWINLKGHAKFREILGDEDFKIFMTDIDLADTVARDLTYFKDEQQKRDTLAKLKIEGEVIDKLCKISFTDFVQLSIKAINAILPLMKDGQRYDEAILSLGKPSFEKSIYLPPLKDTDISILNPTVIRAFSEFRKVANALVRKYGSFDKVHFELARDVNTKADIEGMKKGQLKNEKARAEAKEWINENFNEASINGKNILKKRLYEQQDGRSVYSGETILLTRLFEDGYCEVDHILPRSRSGDDSMANKVLVLSKENQDKSNLTPFEWFGEDMDKWSKFEQRINTAFNVSQMGKGKINRLLKKNFDASSESEFLSRNINDTRYMAKAIKTYCENYWKLAREDDKQRIQVRSGKLTSELRGRWIKGYIKDRTVHTHHALDAIVIAFATQSMVQKLSTYYGAKETWRAKEKPVFSPPMENFRDKVAKMLEIEKSELIKNKDGREIEVKRLLISRPPRASVTGQAHEQTPKPYPRVEDIKNKKNRRFAAVDEYKFEKFKNDKIASSDGKNFYEPSTKPRVDIYKKGGKYHVVPLYLSDMVADELPNVALGTNPEKMEEKDFCFSVFKDDIIEIETKATPKKPSKKVLGYFSQLNGANFILSSVDNAPKDGFLCTPVFSIDKDIGKKQKDICKHCPEENKQSGSCPMQALEFWQQNSVSVPRKDFDCDVGVKFAVAVRKYQIDLLGYYHEVKNERRLGTIPQEALKNGVNERRKKKRINKKVKISQMV